MKDFDDFFPKVIIGIVIFMFFVAPIIGISRVVTTKQAINQECNTNYNLIQVALAGDNLARLCQIKNQVVTIK